MKSKLGLLALWLTLGSVSLNNFSGDQGSTWSANGSDIIVPKPRLTLKSIAKVEELRSKLTEQGLTILPLTRAEHMEQAHMRKQREQEHAKFAKSMAGMLERTRFEREIEQELLEIDRKTSPRPVYFPAWPPVSP